MRSTDWRRKETRGPRESVPWRPIYSPRPQPPPRPSVCRWRRFDGPGLWLYVPQVGKSAISAADVGAYTQCIDDKLEAGRRTTNSGRRSQCRYWWYIYIYIYIQLVDAAIMYIFVTLSSRFNPLIRILVIYFNSPYINIYIYIYIYK